MYDRDSMAGPAPASPPSAPMVERGRAQAFGRSLCVLLQRQRFYVPLTQTYLLPQLYERTREVDGQGIQINSLRAYLRGETLPSDSKVRLLADALGVPRGVLLYVAGYLTPEDLPNYPGPNATLENLEMDMREVESLPLSPQTKARILHDLRATTRIVHLVAAERASTGYSAEPLEREHLIEQLITLWESAPAEPPSLTTSEEAARGSARARPASAPAAPPAAARPAPPAPVVLPPKSTVRQ
jgi:transcriptional regulator with XRE-family HTH domain